MFIYRDKFKEHISKEVLTKIDEAFRMEENIAYPDDIDEERRMEILEMRANQAKKTINDYIDWRMKKPAPADLKGETK